MRPVRTRSMEDIGVGVPQALPLPIDEDLLATVIEHASVTRGEGLRHARREIAKDRDGTLRTILTLLQVLVIPRTEEIIASDGMRGAKIECRAGCNYCCHQNVEVSIPEAILVAVQVADPSDPRRPVILESAEAIAGLGREERLLTGRPCALLVDGNCSVYENRPLQCRATLSPYAKGCADALRGMRSVRIYAALQFFAQADKDALRGICKDLGLQYDNVDLVQTVAAILKDPLLVMKWAQGERVFTPLPANRRLRDNGAKEINSPAFAQNGALSAQ